MKTFDVVSRNSVPNLKYHMTVAPRGLVKEKAKNNYLFQEHGREKHWKQFNNCWSTIKFKDFS